jgi:hypothetical protein
VEKCLAKLANDVTEQVRDKLIDILIAVLARECEDFDGESVRRLLVTELETTPLTFALEKRASGTKTKTLKEPKTKTKVVELDADGNPVKKVRTPKEPKEKAPKAVLTEEEREARRAAKKAAKDAEREAAKAAKEAEREAAKEARKAAKETEKDADKEAAKAAKLAEKEAEKAAKLAEREAAKAARKAEKDAEREAAKAAKQAEKEAAPVVAKEQRLPIPWCGKRIEGRCEALRVYHGLFAQCTADATEISAFCPSCEKSGAKFGTCAMRAACGLFDYIDPSGKKCVRLANVIHKFGFADAGEQAFQEEAAKHDITIPYEHLEKEVKQRGRPKSNSPLASKVATSDTGSSSGSETETDDEEHQLKRKQVSKVAASEAPKKRGRPAKNPKSDVTPSDEVIQDLVASAAAMSVTSTPSTPVAAAAKPSAETPAAPKKAVKAVALRKPAQRKTRVIDEQPFWVEQFNGVEILIRQEDNATFEASNGEPLGFWDEQTKTIIECDDEDEE